MTDLESKRFEAWVVFIDSYLENVKKKLPQSFRAKQLETGGISATAVYQFETMFLQAPFDEVFRTAFKLGKESVKP